MKRSIWFSFLLLSAAGFGQQYSVGWKEIAAGGGTSANGAYQISGTIGTHDGGGTMAGGSYALTDGFWAFIAAVSTPGAPTLRIWLTITNTAILTWPATSTGFSLQHKLGFGSANWTDVTNTMHIVGSENQVIVMRPLEAEFYRLAHQ
jgi:hypothetical protein